MSKPAEIAYVEQMASVLKVEPAEISRFLRGKPFTDERRAFYLMDMGQLLRLIPPPFARAGFRRRPRLDVPFPGSEWL